VGKKIDVQFGDKIISFPDLSDMNPLSWGIKGLLLIIGVLWILSGIYIVGPDELGVVRRFGEAVRTAPPGIHYHLPSPFEIVDIPKVTEVKRLEVGFRTIDPGPPARYRKYLQESQMLTGDENIVNVEIIVQYKIKDPENYLFNIRDLERMLRHATEAAIRQTVGSNLIDEVLTTGKFQVQEETKALLQVIVDRYNAGLLILAVQLQDVHPPDEVIQAFKDVASAKEDKDRLINLAKGYQNQVIPKARGDAEKRIREAEGYREERIKTGKGDADRFEKVWTEYRNAKVVTKKRLYLETMEKILPSIQKVIISPETNSSLLNLMDLMGSLPEGEEDEG
jgi:membrane protease subunit HflK